MRRSTAYRLGAMLGIAAFTAACSSPGTPAPTPTVTVTGSPVTVTVPAPDTVTLTQTVVHTRTVTAKPKPKPQGAVTKGYTYKVTAGSGSANDVTYEERGSTEQATGVSLPWSKTVSYCGSLCLVSAQNAGSGTITCEIYEPDGALLDKHSSTGAYAVVSCQY